MKLKIFKIYIITATVLITHAYTELSGEEPSRAVKLMDEASHYYDATLFDKAIPLFEELRTILHSNTKEHALVQLHLARSYYFSGQYSKMVENLSQAEIFSQDPDLNVQKYNAETLFLLALSYGKLQKYKQAADIFLRYLSFEQEGLSLLHFDALYELGMAYFQMEKYDDAKLQFKKISKQMTNKRIYALAQIHLIRIAIAEKNYSEAKKNIENLSEENLNEDFMPFAIAFLKGEVSFSKGDFSAASFSFKEAIPEKNHSSAAWKEDALFYLGLSYLNLSENSKTPENDLEKCEQILKQLITDYPSERAYLSLAQCYLYQGMRLKNTNALQEIESLLSDTQKFTSRVGAYKALLIRAEASSSYDEKKKFFKQLANKKNRDDPFYPHALFLAGLNEFEEGKAHSISLGQKQAAKHLESAINLLQQSFDLSFPKEKKESALCLKTQAEIYFYLSTREAYLNGLVVVGKLLNQYRNDLFLELDNPAEIFFLQGFFAAKLTELETSTTFFNIAENSLKHILESYSKGEYHEEALRILGMLYYSQGQFEKAEFFFSELAHKTPMSHLAAEALFWAANSAEMIKKEPNLNKYYRKKLYELYPDSPFSPEAYFRYYDYAEYLKGNIQALKHLKELQNRYPNSPYTLNALYLIATSTIKDAKKNKINYTSAIETLKELETKSQTLFERKYIPEEKLPYFVNLYYRALLEKGSLILRQRSDNTETISLLPLEEAEKSLSKIHQELNTPSHPLSKFLIKEDSLMHLQEESAYQLTRCYIVERKDDAAIKLLETLIENYQNAKITRGLYLSKIWLEYGKIAARRKNHLLAIQSFKNAEDAAKGKVLPTDDLLDLWIEKSRSHQSLKETDEAMLLLSRVINYDAVSPNRLKAMYFRALIYEEVGRKELARKQLETIAKKNGEWAIKAKEKLEENYVYQ